LRPRAAAELRRSGPQRPAPKSVKLLLPVWGHRYVSQFLEVGLPTLMAPGNVPALAKALPCEFEILTSAADETYIRQHPAFLRLAGICNAVVRTIDHLITVGNNSTTLTLVYAEAIRAAGLAMLDTCFMFLVSDYVIADGSLANVLARVQGGHRRGGGPLVERTRSARGGRCGPIRPRADALGARTSAPRDRRQHGQLLALAQRAYQSTVLARR
jgi:hypothetical protein